MTWQLVFLNPQGELEPCELYGADDLIAADPNRPLADLLRYCVVPIPAGYQPHSLRLKEEQ